MRPIISHTNFLLLNSAKFLDHVLQPLAQSYAPHDIYQWLRKVCSTKLLQSPIVYGGPGVVVELDEPQFHNKPKRINNQQ